MIMACIGGHADVLKVLVEEFGMSANCSDFVSVNRAPICIYLAFIAYNPLPKTAHMLQL